jgi:integrase
MTALRRALADFIRTRRALGFTLRREAKLLGDFVAELDRARCLYVTTAAAIAWATQPRDTSASWWILRLVAVRGFAKYLQTLDPRNEIPPLELLPARKSRSAPYVYSTADITALLSATDTLASPLLRSTYKSLLGLLATTGMRVGEAVALDDTDVDRRRGVLVIRKAKFGKSREVPVHVSTVRALERYVRDRGQLAPRRRTSSFFVSTAGSRLFYQNVHATFLRLVYAAGLGRSRPRPTIHDLRHTFAIRTVLDWYRDGVDVEARLPLLSTYLGHVGPSSTYWYLTAVPELLEAATIRLERSQVMP